MTTTVVNMFGLQINTKQQKIMEIQKVCITNIFTMYDGKQLGSRHLKRTEYTAKTETKVISVLKWLF